MTDGISFNLTGVDELIKLMDSVSVDTRRKSGRFALRKAAAIIANKAKANAGRFDDPATAQNIAANISVRWDGRHFKRTGDPAFRVGVLGGAKQYATTKENVRKGRAGDTYQTGGDKGNPGGDTYYWRFLEFGTSKMPAQPFMRPAAESSVGAVISEFAKQYEAALGRAIRKARKTGGVA